MKNILLVLLIFCSAVSAQGINNKNCPYDVDNLVKTNISGIQIHSYVINIFPDSIMLKNYVANSDHYFDSLLVTVNRRKFHIAHIEYSPTDKDYQKVISYHYIRKHGTIKNKKFYYQFPAHGIGYPPDNSWLEEYFSEALTQDLYMMFSKKMISELSN